MDKIKLKIIISKIKNIQKSIIRKAEIHIDVMMPGFTHSQNAQPIVFSHYMLSFLKC